MNIALLTLITLTFHQGFYTTNNRVQSVPQLQCRTGCNYYAVNNVACQNIGSNSWSCTTQLPSGVQLVDVEVSCEGVDDHHILAGSCSLIYGLRRVGHRDHDHIENALVGLVLGGLLANTFSPYGSYTQYPQGLTTGFLMGSSTRGNHRDRGFHLSTAFGTAHIK